MLEGFLLQVRNDEGDLGGNGKKEKEAFSAQGLFSVINCLITITFRSSLGGGRKATYSKGSCIISKENCHPGWEAEQLWFLEVLKIVPAAVLSVISGSCS